MKLPRRIHELTPGSTWLSKQQLDRRNQTVFEVLELRESNVLYRHQGYPMIAAMDVRKFLTRHCRA